MRLKHIRTHLPLYVTDNAPYACDLKSKHRLSFSPNHNVLSQTEMLRLLGRITWLTDCINGGEIQGPKILKEPPWEVNLLQFCCILNVSLFNVPARFHTIGIWTRRTDHSLPYHLTCRLTWKGVKKCVGSTHVPMAPSGQENLSAYFPSPLGRVHPPRLHHQYRYPTWGTGCPASAALLESFFQDSVSLTRITFWSAH